MTPPEPRFPRTTITVEAAEDSLDAASQALAAAFSLAGPRQMHMGERVAFVAVRKSGDQYLVVLNPGIDECDGAALHTIRSILEF